MKLNLSPAPHVHTNQSTRTLMRNVLIALLPCAVAGVGFFGYNALMVLVVSTFSAVAAEYLWQAATRQKVRVGDLSAAVTGLILGLNLPATAPLWMVAIGSAFAVVIVKGLFGGLGDNFINPALAARAMLLASWPQYMTRWYAPAGLAAVDAVTAATPLSNPGGFTTLQLILGSIPGSVGEVCKIAILLGFAWMLYTKTVTWRIPVVMVASTAVFSLAFGNNPLTAVLSGGLLFGAVFMATDYATCPMTAVGQIVYAALAGLLVAVIRKFSDYPEGVTYAILLMNVASPVIDHFITRRVYGHGKEAKNG